MIYFFTAPDKLKDQDPSQAYGILDDKNFQIASLHFSKDNAVAPAISVVKGEPRYIRDNTNSSILTCVLKPAEFHEFGGVPVDYFIYWGINSESILESEFLLATNNQPSHILVDLKNKISSPDIGHLGLDKSYTEDEDVEEMFKTSTQYIIEGNKEIGAFIQTGAFGFAVVLKTPFNKPKIKHLKVLSNTNSPHIINIKENDSLTLKSLKRNFIVNFMDPAAFFGNNILNSNFQGEFYAKREAVLSCFVNHRWYFDIRNENGLSYNFYSNSVEKFKFKIDGSDVIKEMQNGSWPVLYLDNEIYLDIQSESGFKEIQLFLKNSSLLTVYYQHIYENKDNSGVRCLKNEIVCYTNNRFVDHKPDGNGWSESGLSFSTNIVRGNERTLIPSYNRILVANVGADEMVFSPKDTVAYVKKVSQNYIPSLSIFDNIFDLRPIDLFHLPDVLSVSSNTSLGASKIINENITVKKRATVLDSHFVQASISRDAVQAEPDGEGNVEVVDKSQRRITFLLQTEFSSLQRKVRKFSPKSPLSSSRSSFSHINNGIGSVKMVNQKISSETGQNDLNTLAFIDDFVVLNSKSERNFFYAITITEEEYDNFLDEAIKEGCFSEMHPLWIQIHDNELYRDPLGRDYQEVTMRIAGLDDNATPIFLIPKENPLSKVKDLKLLSVDGHIFSSENAAKLETESMLSNEYLSVKIINDIATKEYEDLSRSMKLVSKLSSQLSFDLMRKLNEYIVIGKERRLPTINRVLDQSNGIKFKSELEDKTKFEIEIEIMPQLNDGHTASTSPIGTEGAFLNLFDDNGVESTISSFDIFKPEVIANIQEFDSKGKETTKILLYDPSNIGSSKYNGSKLGNDSLIHFEPKFQFKRRYDEENNRFVVYDSAASPADPFLQISVSDLSESGIGEIRKKVRIEIDKSLLDNALVNPNTNQEIEYVQQCLINNVESNVIEGFTYRDARLAQLLIHELSHAFYYIKFPLTTKGWSLLETQIGDVITPTDNKGYVYPKNSVGGIHPGHLYANPTGSFSVIMESEFGALIDKVIEMKEKELEKRHQFFIKAKGEARLVYEKMESGHLITLGN